MKFLRKNRPALSGWNFADQSAGPEIYRIRGMVRPWFRG